MGGDLGMPRAPGERTLPGLVERVAAGAQDRVALVAPGRPPLTYGALLGQLCVAAGELAQHGIGRDDRVALVVQNGPEAATAFLALATAAVCAPLNPAYRRAEMDFYLDDLRARAVVVSRTLDSPVRDAAAARGIPILELDIDDTTPAGVFTLGGPVAGTAASATALPQRDLDDVALLLHTSGTTSRPKLVPLRHRNLVGSAGNVRRALALTDDDLCLNVMPLFHIHGLVAALLASIDAGAAVACTPGFHPIDVFAWLKEFRPTWITAVPTMYQSVLARSGDHPDVMQGHRLRLIRSSSASLPPHVADGLERAFGVPVIEAYGMTEAAHQMASNPLPPAMHKLGSVGLPAGPEIAILDADGVVLECGATGEVAIRGETVFDGYEANPEANAAAFTGGWFRTGDEGSLDDDGYVTLTGRLKEQVNRGGEKVSPLEVDVRLLAHPAVAEAVAFAVPDPRLGEEIAAAVVLRDGADVNEAALQDFVAQTLAPFKVPRRILLVDAIPKGPTGKVQRVSLAAQLGLAQLEEGLGEHVEPRSAFERSLARIWSDVLRVPSVGVHDDFFALGGDSILGAEAVARIRELTGNDDLPLVSIVRAPTVAAMAREIDATGTILARSGAIALRPDASGAPFFFVHGGDGEVLGFVTLARELGADHAMYGMRARGIDDGEPPGTSVEEMATTYIDAMRSIRPRGPYAIGGFCFGGTVALEMAQQLAAAGEPVDALVLVDPRLPVPSGLRYNLWLVASQARSRGLLRAVGRRLHLLPRLTVEPPAGSTSAIERHIAGVRERYRPRPYPGPSTLVFSREHGQYGIPDWHVERIVRGARTVRLDVGHTPMLQSPGAELLATAIRTALDTSKVDAP